MYGITILYTLPHTINGTQVRYFTDKRLFAKITAPVSVNAGLLQHRSRKPPIPPASSPINSPPMQPGTQQKLPPASPKGALGSCDTSTSAPAKKTSPRYYASFSGLNAPAPATERGSSAPIRSGRNKTLPPVCTERSVSFAGSGLPGSKLTVRPGGYPARRECCPLPCGRRCPPPTGCGRPSG